MRRHSREHVSSRLRLRGHDYASAASYFITLCTHQRECLFGTISNGEMHPSLAGAMVDSWWHSIPVQFPQVMLDSTVVMPNHLHAIVHIGIDPEPNAWRTPRLSAVIQWFKIRSTNDYIHGVKHYDLPPFDRRLWQSGFYDHVIRDNRGIESIRAYILNNPANWQSDDYFGG